MPAPNNLLQATLNRIKARLILGLVDTAGSFSELTKNAKKEIRREWDLFQEEVMVEEERLNHQSHYEEKETVIEKNQANITSPAKKTDSHLPQEHIDRLRAKVAQLNRMVGTGS